jgi:dTMP kinase
LTLVLDVPAVVAAERRRARRGPEEIFDADDLQARLGSFYSRLELHCPGESIAHLDGTVSPQDVTDAALQLIDAARRRRPSLRREP